MSVKVLWSFLSISLELILGIFPTNGGESDCREWMGIPATSKKFDTRGFVKMKVMSPDRGSLTDLCRLIWRVAMG
jgi:hypothetical protein